MSCKVLYFIASYISPEQVVRLVGTIKSGSPESHVLIHHDYSKSYLDPAFFNDMQDVYLMERHVSVEWGDFTMVQMVLHCINWIINRSVNLHWIIFLSGQDYPIKPLKDIEIFLKNTEYDGFMRYGLAKDILFFKDKESLNRYSYRYYKLPKFPYYYKLPMVLRNWMGMARENFNKIQPLMRIVTAYRGKTRIGIRRLFKPFTTDFKCYRGSPWFILNYKCIDYIHHFVKNNPHIVNYYKHSFIPEESFFHSILLNNTKLKIVNDYKRYIVWSSNILPHPNILTTSEFNKIISSNKFFARKFDTKIDANVLDLLDKYISA